MTPLYVLGYPGPYGGACTELWHTLKLWRRFGWEVHCIPTWHAPDAEWKTRVGAIGCITHQAKPTLDSLRGIDGLAGATVVSFCNDAFLAVADLLREVGCRLVWANCMNWLFSDEKKHYEIFGPFDAYMFQSEFQRQTLAPQLAAYGVQARQCHRIPGAFDLEEFPWRYRPRDPREPFVIGRISRASEEKYSTNSWPIYERIDYQPKRGLVLGWEEKLVATIGKPPAWVECLAPDGSRVREVLERMHCYCQIAGSANENWPRTGLEAMATGVPIVVEGRGGWCEMLKHNVSGFLCTPENPDAEIAHWVAHLAYDEARREEVARAARARLESELADPAAIEAGWLKLFESLPAAKPVKKSRTTNKRTAKARAA